MARAYKHDHVWRIISHYYDWTKVLVMCKACPETKVWTPDTHRIKIAPRKYRSQSPEEFSEMVGKLEHLCCE